MRTVADDEVVQHVRVEAGEGPADGSAPVVAHQGEPPHPETLHQRLDVVCQLLHNTLLGHDWEVTNDLHVVLVQVGGLLTLAIPSVVYSDDSELFFEVSNLMSPDEPELREAVTEQHDGLLLVPLSLHPGLDIVKLDTSDLDVVVTAVLRVLEAGGRNPAGLHLEHLQPRHQQPPHQPEPAGQGDQHPDQYSDHSPPVHQESLSGRLDVHCPYTASVVQITDDVIVNIVKRKHLQQWFAYDKYILQGF